MSNWTFGFFHREPSGKISDWHSPEELPPSGVTVILSVIGTGDQNRGQVNIRTGWYGSGIWHLHNGRGWAITAWMAGPEPFKG